MSGYFSILNLICVHFVLRSNIEVRRSALWDILSLLVCTGSIQRSSENEYTVQSTAYC